MDRKTLLSAIAYNIEQGIANSEEGKWDEPMFEFRTKKASYQVRLTDEDEYQPKDEGRDGFPDGCVLIVAADLEEVGEVIDAGNYGMIGKWMDYGNDEEWIAKTLLSYADEYETASGGEQIEKTTEEWYAYSPREYTITYSITRTYEYEECVEAWTDEDAERIAKEKVENNELDDTIIEQGDYYDDPTEFEVEEW